VPSPVIFSHFFREPSIHHRSIRQEAGAEQEPASAGHVCGRQPPRYAEIFHLGGFTSIETTEGYEKDL
jgi:hypothetical protein